MKLINTLPEVFEEFNEQRKNSFITALEMKEKGIPFVGVFCTYLPQEIPLAMGASVVGLCSMSGETIPDAKRTCRATCARLSNRATVLPRPTSARTFIFLT